MLSTSDGARVPVEGETDLIPVVFCAGTPQQSAMRVRMVVVRSHGLYQVLLGLPLMDTHYGWVDRLT